MDWFGPENRHALDLYFRVYDEHYQAINDASLRLLEPHPEFGPIIRGMTAEQLAHQNRTSRNNLRRAIEDEEWKNYEGELRLQGRIFAELGVTYGGWYDVVSLFHHLMTPVLIDTYGDRPSDLKASLDVMHRLVDRSMVAIGEEYLNAKEVLLRASEANNARAQEANRAQADFLAMMSHELRTPLNAIIGFSEILVDGRFGTLNDRQLRYTRHVHDSGKHLLRLINDLLDLSKIEAGKLEIAQERCDPAALVAESIAMLQPSADGRGVKLIANLGAKLPHVTADATRFTQILYNFLSNAIKFTPPAGTVTVSCSLVEGGSVRIAVTDTGSGISPTDLGRLFNRFVQLDNAKDAPRSGTGLGLALTRELAELMGAKVSVESEVGVGSTFRVDLPIAATAPATLRGTVMPVSRDAPLALIVDDHPAATELLELTLARGGYRTCVATNGEEALALARNVQPDLITLDVFLPTINGWDVLRILKSDTVLAHIPVVMITMSDDRRTAFALGAVEHMVKPIDSKALLAVLGNRLAPHGGSMAGCKVLVVDDDPKHLELMQAELEPHGFSVAVSQGGRAGIAAALESPPDFLLLDLVMPDLSGIEVVDALKNDEKTRNVPIMMITGAELSREEHRRLNGHVEAILSKAELNTDELLALIGRVRRR